MTIQTKVTRSMQAFPKAVLAVTIAAASGLVGLQAMASNGGQPASRAPVAEATMVASIAASRTPTVAAVATEGCMRQVRVITTGYNIPTQARCATPAATKAR